MVKRLNASKLHINKRGTLVLSNWQFALHSLAIYNRKIRNTNDYDENKAKCKVGAISASNLNLVRERNINRLILG